MFPNYKETKITCEIGVPCGSRKTTNNDGWIKYTKDGSFYIPICACVKEFNLAKIAFEHNLE